ncbi:MAG: hypothetical protein HY908_00080 [Myxococcales bacterium]|nr:hypothetical protein [Myxococcales bacterium]
MKRWRFSVVLACALAPLFAASCGKDDPVDEGCGGLPACENGLLCQVAPNGQQGCYCQVGTAAGCGAGLECQAVAGAAPGCFCSALDQTGCTDTETCEQVVGANTGCFPAVHVKGLVFDLTTDAAIEGAVVVARDANNVAVSELAVTDATGHYDLVVPTPRLADGTLTENAVTLRADAEGYLTFPRPPRVALPFDTANATGTPLTVETPATDVGLIPLANTTGLGTITGHVLAPHPQGTLVVAGGTAGQGGAVTGVADFDGSYTVFNVPAGTVAVHGYAVGLQLADASADVTAGQVTPDVDLASLGGATAVVSGNVQIVNPGNGSDTSVILVVDETFNPDAASGETPPGLRIYPVSGAFELAGVPDGNYAVLAAFENDFLVRDPDTSISGTDVVHITVSGQSMSISEGFKITGSLDDVSPDAEEVVSGTPTFVFADDSGEDHYEIAVYDVFGTLVWENLAIPGVSGSATVSVDYAGPPLASGMLYQFRATSIKGGGTPLSRTEDLRGVFLYQ